jgi:hypothetical protein
MNILPLVAMIFASLYQGISQTSTAFALAALIAVTFAAGLFQEFRVHRVMFASDPVSAVTTRPKVTKKEQRDLFYSSLDYETFDLDNHSIQAHQELQREWESGAILVADPSAETLQPIAEITHVNDLESIPGELPCHLAPSIISEHDSPMPKAATDTRLTEFLHVASVDTFEDQKAGLLITIAKNSKDRLKINSLWRIILQLDSSTTLRLQSTVRGYLRQKRRARMTACVVSIQSAARMSHSKYVLQGLKKMAVSTTPSSTGSKAGFSLMLHAVPLTVSTEVPAQSLPLRRSERIAARRAADRNLVPSIPLPRHTISVPMGLCQQEAPKRQSVRLAAKECVCYKAFFSSRTARCQA